MLEVLKRRDVSRSLCVFNSKSCIKMATTDAYTATGIKFQRKRDTADVSKVRREILHELEIFLSSTGT